MVTVETNFPGRPFRLSMTAIELSYSIPGNYSTVSWSLSILRNAPNPAWSNFPSTWSALVAGVGYGGTFTFDFRNSDSLLLAAATLTVPHNADGSGQTGFAGQVDADLLGHAYVSGILPFTNIPRGPRVRVGGVWRNTVAYVRVGGQWRVATPYVRVAGQWRIGAG